MRKKLDPENLEIILLNAFMDEFFPEDKRSVPDTFDLMHYNGIPGSNINNKVKIKKQMHFGFTFEYKFLNFFIYLL